MAGNVLANIGAVKTGQERGIYFLGWFAQTLGFIAGSFSANSWPGKSIRWVFELFPAWVIQTVLFIWFVAWFIDIIKDLTPNQPAITFGFMAPILAASSDATGTLASRIVDWSDLLRTGLGNSLGEWVGNVGPGPLGITLMAAAVIIGKRVLAKQAAQGGGR